MRLKLGPAGGSAGVGVRRVVNMATTDSSQRDASAAADLSGRTALVTGAAGDIGRAIARRLAARGARLVLTDLESAADGLDATVAACREIGAAADVVVEFCDVTSEQAVDAMFDRLDGVAVVADLLVNNAGYQGDFANTVDYDVSDLRRVLDVNIAGVFLVLRRFANVLVDVGRSGSVVNIASMAQSGAPNMLGYSASKAAVVALTKTAAKDLAADQIRVNSVSPAFIGPGAMWDRQVELQAATPSQYFASDAAEVAAQMIGSVPMRRYGTLDEVAAAVQFLLSDEASYVTGFDLHVSGGAV